MNPVKERLKRSLGSLLRIGFSLLALGLLLRTVGAEGVLVALRGADVGLLWLAWALFLLGIVIRVFRWRALLHGLGLRPPFSRLLKLYLVGGFFNAFLPTGFGGDVVRVLELGGDEDRSAVLGTVFVDRLTGILSLLALGLLVLPFARGLTPWLRWLYVGMAVGGLVAGGLLLEGRLLQRFTRWLPDRLSLEGEGKVAQTYAAIAGRSSDGGAANRAMWQALGYSTLFNLVNVTLHWLCALAVGIELGLPFYFVIVPLLALTLLLPISIGGLGARDVAGQLLLAFSTVSDTRIAAWTLSIWAVTAAAGLIGGLIYLWQGAVGLARGLSSERQS